MVEKIPQDTEDNDGRLKPIARTNIGVFGAQGHFGQSLTRRLEEVRPPEIRVTGTVDKNHNPEIASQSDLVIISVQPQYVTSLIADMYQSLKPHAQILSFAVGIPMKAISDIAKRPVARAMADPWWNFAAWVQEREFNSRDCRWIFERLGNRNTFLDDERELDHFTSGIAHLYVSLLYSKMHSEIDVNEHMKYLSWIFRSPPDNLLAAAPEGDPTELLEKMATKGGVTEAALHTLREKSDISPEELFAAITNRQDEIKKGVPS